MAITQNEWTDAGDDRMPDDHPLRNGWYASIEAAETAKGEPESDRGDWMLEETAWYPHGDLTEQPLPFWRYAWIDRPLTPREVEFQAAVELMEQIDGRRSEIEAILTRTPVAAVTIPGIGITVARFSDLKQLRDDNAALTRLLLDVTATAGKLVTAGILSDPAARAMAAAGETGPEIVATSMAAPGVARDLGKDRKRR